MREIKFRAWGRHNEYKMFYEVDVDAKGVPSHFGAAICEPTLMQYTGVKDERGKEIYEGDVLKIKHDNFDDQLYTVVFEEGLAAFSGKPISGTGPLFSFGRRTDYALGMLVDFLKDDLEIVGNIYENL